MSSPDPIEETAPSKREGSGRARAGLQWIRPDRAISRLAAAVQNGVEIARFGRLGDRESSPHDVVGSGPHYRLRRYFPDASPAGERPPALLVPPLMLTAEVWDVSPETSAVAAIHSRGADPYVVDFGSPEEEQGGLERTLSDHVLAVSEAVAQVRELTGRDVHLMGYSQGGIFCYQAAALRRGDGIASLVGFGTPVDTQKSLPPFLPEELALEGIQRLTQLQTRIFPAGLPSWATRTGFRLMDPVKTVRSQIDFVLRLYDREALQRDEGTRRFLEGEGWLAYPGPALHDFSEQLVAHNALMRGGVVISGQLVTLADIDCPILIFSGDTDSIAPQSAVRAIGRAAPAADIHEVSLQAGHFGLVVGSRSAEITWPTVSEWIDWREGGAALPARSTKLEVVSKEDGGERTAIDEIREGLSLAFHSVRNLLGGTGDLVTDRAGSMARVSGAIGPQLRRLARLANLRGDTRISMGLALAERARETPDATFFLYEGRAHTFAAADQRVDNVVRGLISLGVRQGEHVALAIHGRPSALVTMVALSRLGAVPLLLRPDLDMAAQLGACPAEHLVASPESAEAARKVFGRDVYVLGGGGVERSLSAGIIDMEAIDPEMIELPTWYEPNPSTADELCMVLVSITDDAPSLNRISNRRFATSALGTTTACALSSRDTLYCRAPTYHPTGALVCLAGALVSGARLALTSFSSTDSFWDDVRRYGVNVVFYTGTFCRELLDGPETPAERYHPIRLFAGSGMPTGLWQRVIERFAPANVVELYATTEGNAVLVNLSGRKVGSVGQPLPGGAELEVASWNLDRRDFYERPSGFKRRAASNETGMLMARVDPGRGETGRRRPQRSVFEKGDAWTVTGDLVRRDEDGDFWLVDRFDDVIRGREGGVPTIPIEDAILCDCDEVELVDVYGVTLPGTDFEVPVAALTLRSGRSLDLEGLRRAVATRLQLLHRPVVVRVLEELPLTAGLRVRTQTLRREGFGLAAPPGHTFWLSPDDDSYIPLAESGLSALVEAANR